MTLSLFTFSEENLGGSLSAAAACSGGRECCEIPVGERASQGVPTWQAFVCSEERELGAQRQGVADRT